MWKKRVRQKRQGWCRSTERKRTQQTRLLRKQEISKTGMVRYDLRSWWEKIIFQLARDRDRDSKDTTRTSAMKRSGGTLVTGVKQVLRVWDEYFKKLLNPGGECEIDIPHYVRRELEVRTITEEEMEKAVKKMKTGKAVGVFNVCFTTGEIPT